MLTDQIGEKSWPITGATFGVSGVFAFSDDAFKVFSLGKLEKLFALTGDVLRIKDAVFGRDDRPLEQFFAYF